MILRVHTPAFPLNQYISGLVYYEGLEPVHTMDRFLPDGNTEIIINLADAPQPIYDNETLKEIQTCRRAWVSGVRMGPITIPSGRGNRMLIVAFHKGRASPFYPFPMSEIADSVVEAELIFGGDIHDLREQLLAAPSIGRMFRLAEAFLLRQAGGSLCADGASKCIGYAVSSMVDQPGGLAYEHLSHQIGYSQKHFIDLFKRQVGVPPKQYMKIMRFQKAILGIERDAASHWSGIALQSGYYDQSHFINEFRCLSGFTPGGYIKRKSDLLNYVPVG